jgi:hypothetical protein
LTWTSAQIDGPRQRESAAEHIFGARKLDFAQFEGFTAIFAVFEQVLIFREYFWDVDWKIRLLFGEIAWSRSAASSCISEILMHMMHF